MCYIINDDYIFIPTSLTPCGRFPTEKEFSEITKELDSIVESMSKQYIAHTFDIRDDICRIYNNHENSLISLNDIRIINDHNEFVIRHWFTFNALPKPSKYEGTKYYKKYCLADGVVGAELYLMTMVWRKMRNDLLSQNFDRKTYQKDVCDFLLTGNVDRASHDIDLLQKQKTVLMKDNQISSARLAKKIKRIDKSIDEVVSQVISKRPTIKSISIFYNWDVSEYNTKRIENVVMVDRLLDILSTMDNQEPRTDWLRSERAKIDNFRESLAYYTYY